MCQSQCGGESKDWTCTGHDVRGLVASWIVNREDFHSAPRSGVELDEPWLMRRVENKVGSSLQRQAVRIDHIEGIAEGMCGRLQPV